MNSLLLHACTESETVIGALFYMQNDLRLESIKEKLKMETYLKLFGFLDRVEAKASETHKLSQLQWELLTLVEQQEGIAVEELPPHLYAFMWCGDELSELDKLLATLRYVIALADAIDPLTSCIKALKLPYES
jgi:hypothetical protein